MREEEQRINWGWEEKLKDKKDDDLITVMFDDDDEYVRFVDTVFDQYGGES